MRTRNEIENDRHILLTGSKGASTALFLEVLLDIRECLLSISPVSEPKEKEHEK